jgi:hypothetical protein
MGDIWYIYYKPLVGVWEIHNVNGTIFDLLSGGRKKIGKVQKNIHK